MPGIPADGQRDVPDISLDASPDHDSYLYCTQVLTDGSPNAYVSSCQATSFRISDQGQQDDQDFLALAGGTSFAAPEFAGLLAVIEQKLATGGGGLGNINPSLTNWHRMRLRMRPLFTTSPPGTTRCPARPVRPIARRVPTRSLVTRPVLGMIKRLESERSMPTTWRRRLPRWRRRPAPRLHLPFLRGTLWRSARQSLSPQRSHRTQPARQDQPGRFCLQLL